MITTVNQVKSTGNNHTIVLKDLRRAENGGLPRSSRKLYQRAFFGGESKLE